LKIFFFLKQVVPGWLAGPADEARHNHTAPQRAGGCSARVRSGHAAIHAAAFPGTGAVIIKQACALACAGT